MCVCVYFFTCVCLFRIGVRVCVSQKSNGNENNEARFCAHISKAKQKKPKETSNIEWGVKKKGGVQKNKGRAREIVRCVKLKKYIYMYTLLFLGFCSNPLHFPYHFRHFAHVL